MTAVVKQDHATGGPQLAEKREEDQGGPPFPAEDRPGGDDAGSEKKGPEPGEVAAAGAASSSPPRPRWKKVWDFVAGQWLTIGFGLACLLAHFFPCKYTHPSSSSQVAGE